MFFKTVQREAVYTSWFSPTLQHELREPSVELRFVLDHIFTIESLIRNKQACRVPGDVQCVSNSRPTDYTGPVRISVVRNHLQFLAVIISEHLSPAGVGSAFLWEFRRMISPVQDPRRLGPSPLPSSSSRTSPFPSSIPSPPSVSGAPIARALSLIAGLTSLCGTTPGPDEACTYLLSVHCLVALLSCRAWQIYIPNRPPSICSVMPRCASCLVTQASSAFILVCL